MDNLDEDIKDMMNEFFVNSDKDINFSEDINLINESDENIKSFVTQMYKKYFNRKPDNDGLEHYFNMIKFSAITGKDLVKILKDSDECLGNNKFINNEQVPINVKNVSNTNTKNMMNEFFVNSNKDIKFSDDVDLTMESDENVKLFITQIYKKHLNRKPDDDGLKNYFNMITSGTITGEDLVKILKESDEYLRNNKSVENEQDPIDVKQVPIDVKKVPIDAEQSLIDDEIKKIKEYKLDFSKKSSGEIIYCMIGTNRLHEIKPYIEQALFYVDKFIFIDGGSEDGTIDYLNGLNDLESYKDKVEVYVHPWQDKFSAQRNNYLNKLDERNYKGWCLVSDSDEHFTIDTLIALKNIINEADEKDFNSVQFQVKDVVIHDIDGEGEITSDINDYWKLLLYRYYPNLRYYGEPHETLIGVSIKPMKTNYIYTHTRSQVKVHERAVENFFISNSNRYSDKWAEFRFLCTINNIMNFKEFFIKFKNGDLSEDIEKWLIDHKDDNEDGDSEVREMYKLYYEILHKDKLINEKDINEKDMNEKSVPSSGIYSLGLFKDKENDTSSLIEIEETCTPIFTFVENKCRYCGYVKPLFSIEFSFLDIDLNMCKECWIELGECIKKEFGD